MTRLSTNFTLKEMTRSQKASMLGIDNSVKEESEIENLIALCVNVLELVRAIVGGPVTITSGYRCATLNARIGGAKNSQHRTGQAADIVIGGDLYELALAISASSIPFDQLIYENLQRKDGGWSRWIHISHCRHGKNRGDVLTMCHRHGEKRTYTTSIHHPKG